MQVTTRKAGPVTILDVSGEIDFANSLYSVLSRCVRSKTTSTARASPHWSECGLFDRGDLVNLDPANERKPFHEAATYTAQGSRLLLVCPL
jgi:hypothetical protein